MLNPLNRAHDLDNLYVVDASFLPTSGGLNPSLTIAANACAWHNTWSRDSEPSRRSLSLQPYDFGGQTSRWQASPAINGVDHPQRGDGVGGVGLER